MIDRTHSDYIAYQGTHHDSFEENAEEVWQELCNRLTPVAQRLKNWIHDFSLIPSHSFYTRVHKFHIKVSTDEGGIKDFRRFYRENMGMIWHNEIASAGKASKAFGDWAERSKALQEIITSENFKIY